VGLFSKGALDMEEQSASQMSPAAEAMGPAESATAARRDWNRIGAIASSLSVVATVLVAAIGWGLVYLTPKTPYEKLATLGINWTEDNFLAALRSHNNQAVEIFAEGKMRLRCRMSSQTQDCDDTHAAILRLYASDWFDPESARAILKYGAFDPMLCPVPPTMRPWDSWPEISAISYTAQFYTKNLQGDGARSDFVKRLCDTEVNRARVKERLAALSAFNQTSLWRPEYSQAFVQGKNEWRRVAAETFGVK